MSDAVVYEQLDQEAQPAASAHAGDHTGGEVAPFEAGPRTARTCAASATS